jgi:hypothetical protein
LVDRREDMFIVFAGLGCAKFGPSHGLVEPNDQLRLTPAASSLCEP